MRSIRILVCCVICISIVSATASWAAPPTRTSFHLSFPPDPLASCGAFDILWGSELDIEVTTHFNNQGEAVREIWRLTGSDIFVNSLTGAELIGRPSASFQFDLVEGDLRAIGRLFQVVIPGVGVVLIDAGLLVDDDGGRTLNGKHQFYSGDFDELCAALAVAGKPTAKDVAWANLKKLYR